MVNMLRPDGNKIKILRIRRGWQREQLALNAGIRPRIIQRVEAGGNASLETLLSLAKALEVDARDLLLQSVQISAQGVRDRRHSIRESVGLVWDFAFSACQPYAPAFKGILASFALVLLVAFAIRVSPMLADLEPEIGTVEPTQFIAQHSPRTAPANVAIALPLGKRSEVSAAERRVPSRETAHNLDIIPMAMATEAPVPREIATPIEHPHVAKAAEATPAKSIVHGLAGGIDVAWLRSLGEPEPIEDHKSGVHVAETARTPEMQAVGPAQEAHLGNVENSSSGGTHPLARAFVRSGKTTAIFFSKVGGSIKRAF